MKKITSFTIDHNKLLPGVYVSRKDAVGNQVVTTFDLVPLVQEMFEFVRDFEGEVPGACAKDCGNFRDMNLPMAKYLAKKYLDEVLENMDNTRLIYPE